MRIEFAVVVALASVTAVGCGAASADAPPQTEDGASAPAPVERGQAARWTERDWEIFSTSVARAAEENLAALEPGEAVGRLARTFVGTPYTPGTLEVEGPESLVINFREFDCVTFVENMLAMTRFIRSGGADLIEDRAEAQAVYERHLADLRYRGGVIDGYPTRLHYFSEWLADNERSGLLRIVTGDLEPAADSEPISFMSTHPEAYRQLADLAVRAAITEMERRLNAAGPRRYVPEERIASVAEDIRTGDVIAATSTVEGLDIAHTGIALRIGGRLHMIHAPLVGSAVQISEAPLADRIRSISTQDGIMVARWAER